MAFFKFRQRGPSQPDPRAPGDASASGGAQETIDDMRRRARHRLIGAAALVAAAIVGFPLLFDSQPRPVAVDAPITIPDKDKAPPLQVPDMAVASQGSAVPAAASLGASEEIIASSASEPERPASPAAQASSRPAADPSRARSDADAQAKREADAQRDAEAKARRDAEQQRAQQAEAARVRALLEGRPPPAAEPKAAPNANAASGKGRFVVQIGAFADAGKVRQVRQQAEKAGLVTYTQSVDTKDGKRTRVRAGPYASRAEADKAAAALKKAGLPGSILTL